MNDKERCHPSNVFKFCPFCGSNDFVWDGEKSFKCKQCSHGLYINQATAVVAIIMNNKGELLLTRRKNDPHKGMLDLPGGFGDLGEPVEATVVREVKEELNLDVKSLKYFGSFPNRYVFGGLTYFTSDLTFICEVDSFSHIQAADDVSEYIFMPLSEVKVEDVGLDSIKVIVSKLKEAKQPL